MSDLERLRRLVADALKLPVEDITAESGLQVTPGWDSMAHVSILVAMECEFGVNVDEALMNCRTVAELAEKISGQQAG